MYDIIGDIHGHAKALKALLHKLAYREIEGIWQHEGRQAVFLGYYIDRGPEIKETLQIVKGMVDAGHAIALMGNHEYNALAYAHKLPSGGHLREHNDKHNRQHRETLQQFQDSPVEWMSYLEWFRTLPIFYEGHSFRAVHACWDDENINWLRMNGHQTMTKELLVDSHNKNSKDYGIIEETLKGKEVAIPEKYAWADKEGHVRTENRVKWWKDHVGVRYRDLLFNCPPEMENNSAEDIRYTIYLADAKPVFFGHYWLTDREPVLQSHNVACLDYSIAKEGLLVAYRFQSEQILDKNNLVYVSDQH